MGKWNDSDNPLAFLITFRTYGTWLHGDQRGSIDRYHNDFLGPRAPANILYESQQRAKLKSKPFIMNAKARKVVELAVIEVCEYRSWSLKCLNIRSNHGHVVVGNHDVRPEKMMRDLKAYSTRRLKEAGEWIFEHSPWADSGSQRYLWTEDHVWNACEYVINGQGCELPESFD